MLEERSPPASPSAWFYTCSRSKSLLLLLLMPLLLLLLLLTLLTAVTGVSITDHPNTTIIPVFNPTSGGVVEIILQIDGSVQRSDAFKQPACWKQRRHINPPQRLRSDMPGWMWNLHIHRNVNLVCVCDLTFNDSSLWGEQEEQHQSDIPQHGGAAGVGTSVRGGSCVGLQVGGWR